MGEQTPSIAGARPLGAIDSDAPTSARAFPGLDRGMGSCNCCRDLSLASWHAVQPDRSCSSQLGAGLDRLYARLCDQPVRSLLAGWPLSRPTVAAVLAQRGLPALDRLAHQEQEDHAGPALQQQSVC